MFLPLLYDSIVILPLLFRVCNFAHAFLKWRSRVPPVLLKLANGVRSEIQRRVYPYANMCPLVYLPFFEFSFELNFTNVSNWTLLYLKCIKNWLDFSNSLTNITKFQQDSNMISAINIQDFISQNFNILSWRYHWISTQFQL